MYAQVIASHAHAISRASVLTVNVPPKLRPGGRKRVNELHLGGCNLISNVVQWDVIHRWIASYSVEFRPHMHALQTSVVFHSLDWLISNQLSDINFIDEQQEWQFHSSVSLGMEERPTQCMWRAIRSRRQVASLVPRPLPMQEKGPQHA